MLKGITCLNLDGPKVQDIQSVSIPFWSLNLSLSLNVSLAAMSLQWYIPRLELNRSSGKLRIRERKTRRLPAFAAFGSESVALIIHVPYLFLPDRGQMIDGP